MNCLRGDSVVRRFAALTAVLGLLVQLAVAAFLVPAAFAAANTGPEFAGLRTIVICTGAGMKRIVIDAQGNPVEQQDGEPALEHCRVCHLAGTIYLAAPATPDYGAPAYSAFRSAISVRQTVVAGICPLCPESRGPPLQL